VALPPGIPVFIGYGTKTGVLRRQILQGGVNGRFSEQIQAI